MQVFSIILKGEAFRGADILKALEETGCIGVTVSEFYLSDPKTYRVMVSYIDSARVDVESIKTKLKSLGFTLVNISAP
jgi:tRNA-dihydrouridine synthase